MTERIYFETSAFNYFVNAIPFDAVLHTRELQLRRGRELYISTTTVQEVLLTGDVSAKDRLVFAAQNLFAPALIGSPGELTISYIKNGYPNNKNGYSFSSECGVAAVWKSIVGDAGKTMYFENHEVPFSLETIRDFSTSLDQIVGYSSATSKSELVQSIFSAVNLIHADLKNAGTIKIGTSTKYDVDLMSRISVFFVFLIFGLKIDPARSLITSFCETSGWQAEDVFGSTIGVLERYPDLLRIGPILEMSLMAYHQLKESALNRGTIFDAMHMISAPFMSTILFADEKFRSLRKFEDHYSKRLRHVDEIDFRITPYEV